jgi:hypothetical protein
MSEEASWSEDPEEFERRWKLSYEDFRILIQALPPDIAMRYERTLKADEEAAITWVLAYAKKNHLLIEIGLQYRDVQSHGEESDDKESAPTIRVGDIVRHVRQPPGTSDQVVTEIRGDRYAMASVHREEAPVGWVMREEVVFVKKSGKIENSIARRLIEKWHESRHREA